MLSETVLVYKAVKSTSGSSADPASPAGAIPAAGKTASGVPGLNDLQKHHTIPTEDGLGCRPSMWVFVARGCAPGCRAM